MTYCCKRLLSTGVFVPCLAIVVIPFGVQTLSLGGGGGGGGGVAHDVASGILFYSPGNRV